MSILRISKGGGMMERLTNRINNVPDGESGVWVKNHDYISAAEKLAEYEDLEEQGLDRKSTRLNSSHL